MALVKHAYDNEPFYHQTFYHQKLESLGIIPNDIRSIDDLSKISVTTKLQGHVKSDMRAGHVPPAQCVTLARIHLRANLPSR
jgi:phenylacetate-coenzyme A ligase PaaK-like adenylate-forming protein